MNRPTFAQLARTRSAALAVAAAYLVGSMLVLFHFALDRHAVCLEHNTVHHVTVADDHAAAVPDDEAPPGVRGYETETDEHCAFTSFATSTTLRVPPAPGTLTFVDPPLVRLGLRGTTDEIAHISRWRLAPKNSPPPV